MSMKMYLSWRTNERKFSPLGAKLNFLLLFCPPVRLHLHKREMGLLVRAVKGSKDLMKAQSLLEIRLSKDYAGTC